MAAPDRCWYRCMTQAAKDLIARVFRLRTEVSRLRADVNRLGGPRDTVELRHKVCPGGAVLLVPDL